MFYLLILLELYSNDLQMDPSNVDQDGELSDTDEMEYDYDSDATTLSDHEIQG